MPSVLFHPHMKKICALSMPVNDLFLFPVLMEVSSREQEKQEQSKFCHRPQNTGFTWRTKVEVFVYTIHFFKHFSAFIGFFFSFSLSGKEIGNSVVKYIGCWGPVWVDQGFNDLRMDKFVGDKDKKAGKRLGIRQITAKWVSRPRNEDNFLDSFFPFPRCMVKITMKIPFFGKQS